MPTRLQIPQWWQFTKERFDPLSHLLMIFLFVAAHRLLFAGKTEQIPAAAFGFIFAGTLAFFFKLRLYDEIKDYELDLKINPTRPLARGLLKIQDLKRAIALCILFELVLFGTQGPQALAAIGGTILYSLLMYKEFFIREKIRPHLTTYAVSHTFVSGLLSLSLISAIVHQYPWKLDAKAYLFALSSWCLFNIFEFGRKTFTSKEERENVDSYSKIFGRPGAVALVLTMAGASAVCLIRIESSVGMRIFFLTACFLLLGAGILYVQQDRAPFGKLYRSFSSVYIVLIYVGLISLKLWS